MSLYKRRLTQLDGKMGPALRVAYRDVGKEREHGCGSFAPEKAPLCVACMDGKDCSRQSHCISTIHGSRSQGREQDAISFVRYSFGTTTKSPGAILRASPEGVRHRDVSNKLRASRLDWHFFRGNRNNLISVNRS